MSRLKDLGIEGTAYTRSGSALDVYASQPTGMGRLDIESRKLELRSRFPKEWIESGRVSLEDTRSSTKSAVEALEVVGTLATVGAFGALGIWALARAAGWTGAAMRASTAAAFFENVDRYSSMGKAVLEPNASNFAAVGIGLGAEKISRGLTPELQMAVLAGSKYVERQVDSMYRSGISNDHIQRQQEWREQVRRELESMRR